MLLLALGALSTGYTLAYAGVRGVFWDAPWKLWTGAQAGAPSSGVPNVPGPRGESGFGPGGQAGGAGGGGGGRSF